MRDGGSSPYEGLLYADYPTKNGAHVNALARKNVASDDTKREIVDQVNKQMERKIDAKTEDMNPIERTAVRKAIGKAVEKLVERSVDEAVNAAMNNTNKENA
jgi:hypothetical protein